MIRHLTSRLPALLIALWACDSATLKSSAAQNASTAPKPNTSFVPITTQIKKTVVFIQTTCRHIPTEQELAGTLPRRDVDNFVGTGFLLSLTDERMPNGTFVYLITNRHVVQPGIEESKPCDVLDRSVRVNERGVGLSSSILKLPSAAAWEFPADPSVDLAALNWGPDPARYDIQLIPSTQIVTKTSLSEENVAEGDPVLFSGLFLQYPGQLRMEPIVRLGSIAMLPSQPVSTTLRRPGRVYLAEAHVYGGNSGSPMFINLGGIRNGTMAFGSNYKLLGVVAGEYFENQSLELTVATTVQGKVAANSGISIVVPGYEVIDLVNSQNLQSARDKFVASHAGH